MAKVEFLAQTFWFQNSHTKPFFSTAGAEKCYSLRYSQSEILQSKIKNWVSFTDKVPRTSKTTSYLSPCSGCERLPGQFAEDAGKQMEACTQVGPVRTTQDLLQFLGISWKTWWCRKGVTLCSRFWTLASNVECVAAKMEMKCFLSWEQGK